MSDTASSQFEIDYSPAPSSLEEIESSLRMPVLHSIVAGAIWLVVGSLLGLIAVIQSYSPGLFADCSWLTHGKTKAVAWNVLLYGFALQMAIAISLYILCRLSRKSLRHPFTVFVAGKFWNLGVFLGVLGIFMGDATGHEFLGMPIYATAVLFLSFAVIALKSFVVLHYRSDREMYISQLHLGAGALWFLWALSTAIVVLQLKPAVGVAQYVVNQWYVANVFQVVLGGAGLASIYYFLPQFAGRPLHSKEMALTGFWLIVFVGSWTGISGQLPLPAWISGISSVAGFMMLVPLAVVVLNIWKTIAPEVGRVWSETGGKFLIGGLVSYTLWMLQLIWQGSPNTTSLVQFTHFETAADYLFIYGFVGLSTIGGCCTILHRLTAQECQCEGSKYVLMTLTTGVVITVAALAMAGIQQGVGFQEASFMSSITAAGGMLRLGALGAAILLVAAGLFLFEACRLILGYYYSQYPVLDWMKDDETVSVAAETKAAQK
jgi:cytochrome c oxidase cbb3-type subunit I